MSDPMGAPDAVVELATAFASWLATPQASSSFAFTLPSPTAFPPETGSLLGPNGRASTSTRPAPNPHAAALYAELVGE